jgi:hypothetical protein
MNAKKKMIAVAVTIAAVALLVSVPAMAQGPERGNGYRFPGSNLPGIPGGGHGGPVLDNPTDVLVGVLIGGLLIYTIEQNNRNHDDDRYYRDRDRDRYRDRDWNRDHRRYDPRWNRYDDKYSPRHGRDW